MRVMANEAALETALRRRGFAIVRPERLSVARQIALARDAEVIVAPTGAAIANALFAPRGARVIEITPDNYASHWVMALCQLIGAAWRPFYCASPCPPDRIPRLRRMRSYVFGYELPLEPFLAHLDQSL
jgi:capsular polysaccharide biosynthesis protein